jgi:acetyl-CoA decarbonylase/synthase complex subunit delta
MKIPEVKEKVLNKINEVTIGATKEMGGTRGKTITIGGESALPFLTFEGEFAKQTCYCGLCD